MKNNVFSFKQALEFCYEPREYDFKDLPIGIFNVVLDFKVWAEKSPAVTMFCTIVDTGKKIRFNVFRDDKTRRYFLKNTEIDVVEMPYESIFKINISDNSKGNKKVAGVE